MVISGDGVLPATGTLVAGVRRIAVLRSNSIGDFVLALPALEALRAAYPEAEITYLGTDWHPTFLTGRPGPWDRVTCVPAYAGVRGDTAPTDSAEVREFLAGQQAEGYDLAVQLHGGGGNSNPFVTRLGARVTAGSRAAGAPALDRWTPYAQYQHEILRFLEVVGLVGAVPVTLVPHLEVTEQDREELDGVLPHVDPPLASIHPGANDVRRRWPPAAFAAVADSLSAAGASVVLIGSRNEAGLTAAVRDAMRSPVTDLAGRLSLGATTALLARCRVLVGNDSGPRHLAAAVGTATVGVFWCGNLINAGPLTRSRHRVGVSFRTSCPVCAADQAGGRCPHDVSFVADVPVEDVRREALDLLHSG